MKTALVAALAVLAFAFGLLAQTVPSSIPMPTNQQFTNTGRQLLSISGDGSRLVYVANTRLFLQAIGNTPPVPIAGTESQGAVTNPVFSPDGRSVVFWSGTNAGLKRVSVTGGDVQVLCPAENVLGMSWYQDYILFGQAQRGVMRVAANGGQRETIVAVKPNEAAHGPQMLPDNWVLYTLLTLPSNGWDDASIVVQKAGSDERKTLITGGSDARYLPTGHLVYAKGTTLFAVRFDPRTLELTGAPTAIVENVRSSGATGSWQYTFSDSGTLVYLPEPQTRAVLVSRDGTRRELGSLPNNTFAPRISPDGRRVAYDAGSQIWIADFPSLASRRVLQSAAQYPVWSGDGERIVFTANQFVAANQPTEQALFWRRADGTGDPELLIVPARAPEHWSAMKSGLTFITLRNGDYDVWRLSLPDKKAEPLIQLPMTSQHSSRLSPDEKWLAYASDESGQFEIYVQPLPLTGEKVKITANGGEHPVWSLDGREIYYNHESRLYVVPIQTQPRITVGASTPLPIEGFIQGPARRQFDITPDGKQFLLMFPTVSGFAVIPDWFNDVRRRVR